jgi:hypothetical protein
MAFFEILPIFKREPPITYRIFAMSALTPLLPKI